MIPIGKKCRDNLLMNIMDLAPRKIRFKINHTIPKIGQRWSLDPDIKVKDILKQYESPTYDEQIREATGIQKKYRI